MHRFFKISGIILIIIPLIAFMARGFIGFSILSRGASFNPPAGQFLNPEKESFHFSVVSDTGSFNKVIEKLIKKSKTSDPDFFLHLGDFITYRSPEHIYWMMGEILPKLKGTPIYFTPGNHDVQGHAVTNYSAYQQVLGVPSYWFGYGNTLFISLDSATKTISDQDWRLFENVMKYIRPAFKYVILYTHIPPQLPDSATDHVLSEKSADKMREEMRKYPVDLILTGHMHYFSKQDFEGIPLYTVLASGQSPRGEIKKFGYTDIWVEPTGIRIQEHYEDLKQERELGDILVIDTLFTNNIRYFGIGIILGIIFLGLSFRIKSRQK